MQSPLQISFKGLDASDALRSFIEEQATKLEDHFGTLTRCEVVVEQSDRHHAQGRHFQVRIHLGMPNHELAVDRQPGRDERHTDAYAAVRDAFKAAHNQLGDLRQRMRSQDSKHHVQ